MGKSYNREEVLARLIANTKRRKRYDDLLEIARQIRYLEKDLGSLKAVSNAVGVSTDQLRQFLSVEKLSPEVKKLVKERKIDLVNIVHYMKNFSYEDQIKIANQVKTGKFTAGDIRVIAPLRKNPNYTNIDNLISRVSSSKNIRLYVLYFRFPGGEEGIGKLEEIFRNIVGEEEIFSLKKVGQIGVLEVTANGRGKLRQESKKRNLSLREYVKSIVEEGLAWM